MNSIELYIKEKEINISDLERKLSLPSGSIRITGRGIPEKHLDKVKELLIKDYEFNGKIIEVDKPEISQVVTKRVYNVGRIPDWHDNKPRYRDPDNGLWKRLKDWQQWADKETGEIKTNEGFIPISTEILTDEIGEHYITRNGTKVYSFK